MTRSFSNRFMTRLFSAKDIDYLAIAKFAFGALVFFSLVSYDALDPSVFNLLRPYHGIQNWLGLPGALLAAFLFDFLGRSAFALPLMVIFLTRNKPGTNPSSILSDVIQLLVFTTLIAFGLQMKQLVSLDSVGIWGITSLKQLGQFPGTALTLVVFGCFQIYYFKNRRIDLRLLFSLQYAAVFAYALFKILFNRLREVAIQSIHFVRYNWMAALSSRFARFRHKKAEGSHQEPIAPDAKQIKSTFSVSSIVKPFKAFGLKNRQASISPQKDPELSDARRENYLTDVIKTYRKTFYISDSKFFLNLEEEI